MSTTTKQLQEIENIDTLLKVNRLYNEKKSKSIKSNNKTSKTAKDKQLDKLVDLQEVFDIEEQIDNDQLVEVLVTAIKYLKQRALTLYKSNDEIESMYRQVKGIVKQLDLIDEVESEEPLLKKLRYKQKDECFRKQFVNFGKSNGDAEQFKLLLEFMHEYLSNTKTHFFSKSFSEVLMQAYEETYNSK